jgi:hypothetical protein
VLFGGYYIAYSGNSLPTFRYNLSVPSARLNKSKKKAWIYSSLKMWPINCPETSVRNYHQTLCNNPEERAQISSTLKSNVFHIWNRPQLNLNGTEYPYTATSVYRRHMCLAAFFGYPWSWFSRSVALQGLGWSRPALCQQESRSNNI